MYERMYACIYAGVDLLQAGAHEVLGAQYGGGTISADGARKLKPSLINCRRENAFKAQQYGRWIVLNRENPSDTLGDQVLICSSAILRRSVLLE